MSQVSLQSLVELVKSRNAALDMPAMTRCSQTVL